MKGYEIMDLLEAADGLPHGPIKKDLLKTAGSSSVLVCLETGQEIPPHPEPYAVMFVVLQGEGVITSGSIRHQVQPMHPVSAGKDEKRGIRCDQRIVLPSIRDDM